MSKMMTKNLALSIKATEDNGVFEGYASVFDVRDMVGDVVVRGAFDASLKKHRAEGSMPALLWQHQHDQPIGVWDSMEEDGHGLKGRGRLLVDDDPVAKRAFAHLKAGSVTGLSIGFILKRERWDERSGLRYLDEMDLLETSIVTFPANPAARITQVKCASDIHSVRDLEVILREAGYSRSEAKAVASRFVPKDQRDADEAKALLHSLQHSISALKSAY